MNVNLVLVWKDWWHQHTREHAHTGPRSFVVVSVHTVLSGQRQRARHTTHTTLCLCASVRACVLMPPNLYLYIHTYIHTEDRSFTNAKAQKERKRDARAHMHERACSLRGGGVQFLSRDHGQI